MTQQPNKKGLLTELAGRFLLTICLVIITKAHYPNVCFHAIIKDTRHFYMGEFT